MLTLNLVNPIQLTPLPSAVEYFIDCASECADLPWSVVNTLYLFGNRQRLAQLEKQVVLGGVNRNAGNNGPYYENEMRGFIDYATAILNEESELTRRVILSADLNEAKYRVESEASTLRYEHFHGLVWGGQGGRKLLLKKDGSVPPHIDKALRSPSSIRRYVNSRISAVERRRNPVAFANSFGLALMRDESGDIVRKMRTWQQIAMSIFGRLDTITRFYRKDKNVRDLRIDLLSIENQYRLFSGEGAEKFLTVFDDVWSRVKDQIEKTGSEAPSRRVVKENRKVLRRSFQAASAICGEDDARAFLNGNKIVMSGENFNFELQLRKHCNGHGATQMRLVDGGGEPLADMCVFVDNTPVMDQFAAYRLMIDAGEEEALIKTANLTFLTDKAKSDERLMRLASHGDNIPLGAIRPLGWENDCEWDYVHIKGLEANYKATELLYVQTLNKAYGITNLQSANCNSFEGLKVISNGIDFGEAIGKTHARSAAVQRLGGGQDEFPCEPLPYEPVQVNEEDI